MTSGPPSQQRIDVTREGALPTERLVLEPFDRAFAQAVVDGNRSADWAEGFPTDGDVVVAELILAADADVDPPTPANPWGFWIIRRRAAEGGPVIGGVGFLRAPQEGWAEIGYGLVLSARGAGLATEALEAMCRVSERLGIRVSAGTESGNIASERVLARCGFTRSSRTGPLSTWRR